MTYRVASVAFVTFRAGVAGWTLKREEIDVSRSVEKWKLIYLASRAVPLIQAGQYHLLEDTKTRNRLIRAKELRAQARQTVVSFVACRALLTGMAGRSLNARFTRHSVETARS
jgi:hypothetical protein